MLAVNYVVGNQNINMTSQKLFKKNEIGINISYIRG